MRGACIDLGSNTTRLLIGERGSQGCLRELATERVFTRGASIVELADVVAAQAKAARRLDARVRVVATAAVRSATWREELVQVVGEAAQARVEVLSPEEEAALAFLGALSTLDHVPEGSIGVADVGGGSSELVVGEPDGVITWMHSAREGSATLTDRLQPRDPPLPRELDALRDAAASLFPPTPRVAEAWVVGGRATSLRQLVGPTLTPETLDQALTLLMAGPADQVSVATGLHVERVRVLPAALLVLQAAAQAFGVPLTIGCGGLREGVVWELLRAERPSYRTSPISS